MRVTSDQISYLPVAIRALTATQAPGNQKKRKPEDIRPANRILLFDTETTTDPTQRLNFLSYWWGDPKTLETIDEGLVYADDLPSRYTDGFNCLKEYALSRDTSPITSKHATPQFRSRREFVNEVFFQAAYKSRALVVGFNLPFDISRIAVNFGFARGQFFRGGFSFTIWDYEYKPGKFKEHLYRPRICVKHLDSKRSFIGFKRPSKIDPQNVADHFPGFFLDLRTLGFALIDKSQSLAGMCKTLGVAHGKQIAEKHGEISPSYIEYNLRDLLASFEVYQKLRTEFDLHPIALGPHKAYSPASLGKRYLWV